MLFRPNSLDISSPLRRDALAEALRLAGAEWRESTLASTARAAGILGWKVRVQNDEIIVRARIAGRNGFLPYFSGRIVDAGVGSRLSGELRLGVFTRAFALLWFGGLVVGPFAALFQTGAGDSVGERLVVSFVMVIPCFALASFGVWMARRSYSPPAQAFHEWLSRVARVSAAPDATFTAQGV